MTNLNGTDQPELRCSFCNKRQNDVRKLIAGPGVNICDECVETCVDVIADDVQAMETHDGAATPASESTELLGTACALCGFPVLLDDALAVAERGFLCLGCVDAVEAAIAERTSRE